MVRLHSDCQQFCATRRGFVIDELASIYGKLTKRMQDLEDKLDAKAEEKDLDRIYEVKTLISQRIRNGSE
jgi:hypothetical protein